MDRTARRPQHGPTRRDVLAALAALAGGSALAPALAQPLARPAPLKTSFDDLIEKARRAAAAPFTPAPNPAPDLIEKIDYDAHWKIRWREDASLAPGGADHPVQLFHPGRYFPHPVQIYVRDGAQAAWSRVPFDLTNFDMPDDSPAHDLPEGYGYAGFRVMRPGMKPDWVSFLGASYFRTDGPERQYGLSARGIAVDTGLSRPEEFPRFTAFWIGPPEQEGDALSLWAELDGPSVAGAYRIGLAPGDDDGANGRRMRIEAHLFARKPIERLGVAPLTSMYWYSERSRAVGRDWRPEIHDSDGLAIHTGAGERIWRALSNPPQVSTASFFDLDPRGFGLIQRDRDFANYQDDGVFYDRRPSAWITPLDAWGAGAVQLVQIPAHDETFDNIVAYWTPETPLTVGEETVFRYTLDWAARDPAPQSVGWVIATRQGQGGMPGLPPPEGVEKMVVDFAGGPLETLADADAESVEARIEINGGRLVGPRGARRIVGEKAWRMSFDFEVAGNGPATLRGWLAKDGRPLTETWVADAYTGGRA